MLTTIYIQAKSMLIKPNKILTAIMIKYPILIDKYLVEH